MQLYKLQKALDLKNNDGVLSCFVPIELKTSKFKPEYIVQINFYLEALADVGASPEDWDTIENTVDDIESVVNA